MERCVTRGILGIHVGSIKKQMFEVLNHLVAAGLGEGAVTDWGKGGEGEKGAREAGVTGKEKRSNGEVREGHGYI